MAQITDIEAACTQAAEQAELDTADPGLLLAIRRISAAIEILKSPYSDLYELANALEWPLSRTAAGERAAACRDALCTDDIEPLFSLPGLLAEHVNVFTFVVDSERLMSGHIASEGSMFILLGRMAHDWLFQCAVELGYLLTACLRGEVRTHAVLRTLPCGPSSRLAVRGGPRDHFANFFAGSLLLPPRGVGLALQEIRRILKARTDAVGDVELLFLSRIFGVRFWDAARRCEHLELLPKGGAAVLERYLRAQHRDPEARASMLDLPARPIPVVDPIPKPLIEAAARSVRNGHLSAAAMLEVFGQDAAGPYIAYDQGGPSGTTQ